MDLSLRWHCGRQVVEYDQNKNCHCLTTTTESNSSVILVGFGSQLVGIFPDKVLRLFRKGCFPCIEIKKKTFIIIRVYAVSKWKIYGINIYRQLRNE